jgi:hypothetical protein
MLLASIVVALHSHIFTACKDDSPGSNFFSLATDIQKKQGSHFCDCFKILLVKVLLSLTSMALADRHTTLQWLHLYRVLGQDIARLSLGVLDGNSKYIDNERSNI